MEIPILILITTAIMAHMNMETVTGMSMSIMMMNDKQPQQISISAFYCTTQHSAPPSDKCHCRPHVSPLPPPFHVASPLPCLCVKIAITLSVPIVGVVTATTAHERKYHNDDTMTTPPPLITRATYHLICILLSQT